MTILNLEKTTNHIINWIKAYAKEAGAKTLVVGLSGGVDSALTALLCKKTGLPTVCVNMPCHSSNSAYDRAKNFAEEGGLDLLKVDLSAAHESVMGQIKATNAFDKAEYHRSIVNADFGNPIAVGGLRSCLRAPVLSYFANATKGIIVGTGNRSEDNLVRYFQKYGDGCVDISPIADLFKSEVYELFAHLTGIYVHDENTVAGPTAALDIYQAIPTADLWGPDAGQKDESEMGVSYDEIEWADRENMRCNIITNDQDPVNNIAWLGYTARQREVIAKVHQLEAISRHKYNSNLPVCEVRKVAGLVQ